MTVIDVDDASSWPGEALDLVRDIAEDLRGSIRFTDEIPEEPEVEAQISGFVARHFFRAYHCTRLLDYEVTAIREHGLRVLTPELVNDRIERAFQRGFINDEERDELLAGHVFGTTQDRYRRRQGPLRREQVHLILSRQVFDDEPGSVYYLLALWGGEAISMPLEKMAKLRELGRPSIIAVNVAGEDLLGGLGMTSLLRLFVGRNLNLPDSGADVVLRVGLPPGQIEDIWQPGDSEYDRHGKLPRA